MADFDLDEFNLEQTPQKDLDPIPFDDSDDDSSGNQVSHAPLDLGGGAKPAPAAPKPAPVVPKPAPSAPIPAPALNKVAAAPVASEARITGVKIFFTKLHAGAIDFLSDQIAEWLKTNPGIVIKRTDTVVGEIASKKTEPNLIITVWY